MQDFLSDELGVRIPRNGGAARLRTAERAHAAWADLDLPPRWTPTAVADVRAAFVARFGRGPLPVQVAAVGVAPAQERP